MERAGDGWRAGVGFSVFGGEKSECILPSKIIVICFNVSENHSKGRNVPRGVFFARSFPLKEKVPRYTGIERCCDEMCTLNHLLRGKGIVAKDWQYVLHGGNGEKPNLVTAATKDNKRPNRAKHKRKRKRKTRKEAETWVKSAKE